MNLSNIINTILCIMLLSVSLQAQDPANFHLIYGNKDASHFAVTVGDTIEIPFWLATDPTPGNSDTVTFMHDPLASRNLYIAERFGGVFILCDSCYLFEPPNSMGDYTSQSLLTYFYLQDPRPPAYGIYTGGDTILAGYFYMRVTDDSSYIGQTVDAFAAGFTPTYGGTLWGMKDGVRGVVPTISFSRLYFSPCYYENGDANNDNAFDGRDITYSINYLKGIGPEPPYSCECPGLGSPRLAADANGDCHFSGIDVTYSVNYLKGIGPAPRRCPRC